MAVKTTKIQCNQDVDLRGKVDVEGKVTCGNDVEVDGKLTINSAKDLKTKDGSSIGGGGDVSLNKVNEFVNGNTIISLIDTVSNPWGRGYYTGVMSKIKGKTYQTSPFIFIGLEGTGTDLKPVALVADSLSSSASKVEFHVGDYGEWGMVINHNGYTRYLSGEIHYESYHLSFPTKSGTLALKTDIPDVSTKQSILYHHTITLHAKTIPVYFTFSIDNTSQSEITKETLFNVLNGRIVVGTGIVQNILIDKISFRNNASKTNVHQFAHLGLSGYIDDEYTFEDIFGTDYTVEDVTYPN